MVQKNHYLESIDLRYWKQATANGTLRIFP
jgi:hypothetical protein